MTWELENEPDVTADVGAGADVADTGADVADVADAGDAGDPWNGELDSLQSEEWFSSLADEHRSRLQTGLQSKYQNWERGYSQKFSSLAQQRKDAERQVAEARAIRARALKWQYGEEDPVSELEQQIGQLKTEHKTAVDTLRNEYESQYEKMMAGSDEERSEARQQLEAVRGELQALRDAQEAQKDAAEAAAADRLDQDIKTEAPDIHSSDDAFRMLMHLLLSGADRQTAYRAVRAALDLKQEKKAVEPPPSVAAMAAGSLDGAPEQNGDVDSLFKRLYQNAESADGVSQV
jgi:hypothetical protein